MLRKIALLLGLVLAGCTPSAIVPDPVTQKGSDFMTTARLEFEKGICSGTVVQKHTVLSAEHCFKDNPTEMLVNGKKTKILSIVSDDQDHSLVEVELTFKQYAKLDLRKPSVGTTIHYWGNPGGLSMLLRRGYVAGYEEGYTLWDVNGFFGDSGAGIFNEDGQLIAVMNVLFGEGTGFKMMGSKPINFTPQQYAQAGLE
jgi:V8-like Glu-specific endopeptidase